MFRLTREVRFAINPMPDKQLAGAPSNSYGGFPSLTGLGQYMTLAVTLEGDLDPHTHYLRNIKDIDDVVRREAIPIIETFVREQWAAHHEAGDHGFDLPARLYEHLRTAWRGAALAKIQLALSPYLSVACDKAEHRMVQLSEKFEFSASHRLHNPELSDEENRRTYGKCNNPAGHGHNYQLQVTLRGVPDHRGVLVELPAFERIVTTTVLDRFDHQNLNAAPEFRELIPSVENIAKVIYRMLKEPLEGQHAGLASVTVWETSKTWCKYIE